MTLTRLVRSLAFMTALSLGALPAQAQHRGGGGSGGGGGSHGGGSASPSHGVAVARTVPVYSHGSVYSHPYYGNYYRPYYYGSYYRPYYSFVPRVSIGFGVTIGYPVAYPYYYGYPAAYGYGYPPPYAYAYPPASYGYAPPPAYNYPQASQPQGYPQQNTQDYQNYQSYPAQQPHTGNSVDVRPGASSSTPGGVSLEITPSTASVFVDGNYMGTGEEFGPSMRPLGLATGRHRIEVRADGYQTVSFEATVTAGQVVPYQASLQRKQ